MAFSLSQQKALAILPKISGFTSMVASTLIVCTVLRERNTRSGTYHRLIFGTSIIDIFSSFWGGVLSTWPMPSGTALWAVGNTQTCTAQGFFAFLSLGSAMYNASLSFYYLFTIVFEWKEDRILKIERYFHAIPILWTLSMAVAGLPLTLYNPGIGWCGIASRPLGCNGSDCVRGEYAEYLTWAFFYGPLWLMIIIITVNVTCVFLHWLKVRKQSEALRFPAKKESDGHDVAIESNEEKAIESNGDIGEQGSFHFKKASQAALQCFWYASAFYLIWVPLTVARITVEVTQQLRFGSTLVAVTTAPLQGLPTFLIYLGPKLRKKMRGQADTTAVPSTFASREMSTIQNTSS